jgi:drug/metabolite transporter (DMT)-like permease
LLGQPVSGVLWAALSGVAFGAFQVLNARAIRSLTQVYLATFVQLVVATVVFSLVVISVSDLGGLRVIPLSSLGYFAGSGLLHFFLGWTTLNRSQQRIGAARTSPLLATSPIFGLLIAVLVERALPGWVALIGILLTVSGAYVVTDPGPARRASLGDSSFGLATAAAWALSALLTVAGLAGFDDPLLGVTVGMAAAALAYALVLVASLSSWDWRMGREAWALKVLAGVVVAFATWWRWLGLADAPVGVVLGLQLLSVPTVLVILAVRPGGERVTARVWGGAGLVLLGVGLLIAFA